MYVDRGKLHWDDTITKLFPGWKIDPGYAKVTLDQLLHHEGGAARRAARRSCGSKLWTDGDAPDAREKFVTAISRGRPRRRLARSSTRTRAT